MSDISDLKAEIATLRAECNSMGGHVKDLEKTLYGNGRPGLVETVIELKEIANSAKAENKKGFKILTAVVALLLGGDFAWDQLAGDGVDIADRVEGLERESQQRHRRLIELLEAHAERDS